MTREQKEFLNWVAVEAEKRGLSVLRIGCGLAVSVPDGHEALASGGWWKKPEVGQSPDDKGS